MCSLRWRDTKMWDVLSLPALHLFNFFYRFISSVNLPLVSCDKSTPVTNFFLAVINPPFVAPSFLNIIRFFTHSDAVGAVQWLVLSLSVLFMA